MRTVKAVPDEQWEPTAEAQRAIANALGTRHVLRPSSSTLDSSITSRGEDAPRFTGDRAHPPNELRPVNRRLLDAVCSPSGWKAVSFRLTDSLRVGHMQFSQVWGAEVYLEGNRIGRVVLKIVSEALYPPFPTFGEREYSPSERVANGMLAYSALISLQGRDIPHCYGAFRFEMPWGDDAVGFVLEDLHEFGELLCGFVEREQDKLQTVEALHRVMRPSFHQLHRIFALNVGKVRVHTSDIFVLRDSTVDDPHFVFCGLTQSERADTARPVW
ncbi:hypothetical protein JCM3770_007413 [Rhodotorula araucariae]